MEQEPNTVSLFPVLYFLNQFCVKIYLNKKHMKHHLLVEKKKVQALMERRGLKVEVIDLKVLLLKNIVKKELKLKTF